MERRIRKPQTLFLIILITLLVTAFIPLVSESATLDQRLVSEDRTTRETARQELADVDVAVKKALVQPLVEHLKHQDYRMRLWAAEALAALGPVAQEASPALIQATRVMYGSYVVDPRFTMVSALKQIGGEPASVLVQAIKGGDHVLSGSVAYALRKTDPVAAQAVIPTLLQLLKDEDKNTRRRSAEALGSLGPLALAAVPALIEALKDEDALVRDRAAGALGSIGPIARQAVPALIEALGDDTYYVRYSAADALGWIGPAAKEAIPALTELLNDPDKGMAGQADYALMRIDTEDTRSVADLITALTDNDDEVRWKAANALVRYGPAAEEAVPALIVALNDRAMRVRSSAAFALASIGPAAEEAIPLLIELLKDDELHVGVRGDLATMGLREANVVPALVQALKHAHVLVRRGAAEALHTIGRPMATQAVPALLAALKDQDQEVRYSAARALEMIEPYAQEAILVLREARGGVDVDQFMIHVLKEEEDKTVRVMAAYQLGVKRPVVQGAVPALIEALNDADQGVRASAIGALARIGTREAVAALKQVKLVDATSALLDFFAGGSPYLGSLEIKVTSTGSMTYRGFLEFGEEVGKLERVLTAQELDLVQSAIRKEGLLELPSQDFSQEPLAPGQGYYRVAVSMDGKQHSVLCGMPAVPVGGAPQKTLCQTRIEKFSATLSSILPQQ